MNIRFNKIVLDGFMSFDHEELDLNNLGVVQVKGRNHYEPLAESNGSGKSAIIEAIIWNLTGYTSRGATLVSNLILNKGVYVKLDLNIDDHNYIITRSKNHCDLGTDLNIIKDDTDISGSTFTKSKEILKLELGSNLDYDILTSIIILSQGLPGRLSILKPTARKSRLEELSRTDQYLDELSTKLSEAISNINSEMNDIKSKIVDCSTKISSSQFNINNSKSRIDQINDKASGLIDEDTFNDYENNIIPSLNDKVNDLSKRIYDIDLQVSDLTNKNISYNNELNRRINDNETMMKRYSSIHSSTCPTCGQSISDNNKLDQMRQSINNDIRSNKLSMVDLMNKINDIQPKIVDLSNQATSERKNLSDLQLQISKYKSKVNDYQIYNQSTSVLYESIEKDNKIIEEQESLKKSYEDQLKDIEIKMSIATYYKSQISRKFRSFLLEGVIQYINSRCEEYSKYLFEKQGVVKLVIDGNNINIYLGDREFENLSGGEGRRVDIILQLAQRDLARNESGFSSNLLVLDEILDNLDAIGADSVINLLEYKSPDIDTLMIISHKKDITIPCDSICTIVKNEDQISHIYRGE